MKQPIGSVCLAFILSLSNAALAFLPPVDRQAGVTVTIPGFEDKSTEKKLAVRNVPAGEPLALKVVVENKRKEAVAGTLACWMNDDWTLSETNALALRLQPGESKTLTRTATAKPRVLNALYPVHAAFSFTAGGTNFSAHPVAIFKAIVTNRPSVTLDWPEAPVLGTGTLRLDSGIARNVFITQGQSTRSLGKNFSGSDAESNARFATDSHQAGGQLKKSWSIHPPYKNGAGTVAADIRFTLPANQPCSLTFATALNKVDASDPVSDGVKYSVYAILPGGEQKELFSRFSACTEWEPAQVDLSAYAGKDVTLRFLTGPGPRSNTTCDSCFWGAPALTIGRMPAAQTEADWRALEARAVQAARTALQKGDAPAEGRFRLSVRGERFGAAVVPGRQGMIDGVIAFADETGALLYRGFECVASESAEPATFTTAVEAGALAFRHTLLDAASPKPLIARSRVYSDGTALRIAWDMPETVRSAKGTPRYTRLSIGPASMPVWRAYLGFGNVIENPNEFTLSAGGFGLSTRHIGGDYTNGLSLLQASDLYPDSAFCSARQNRFGLVVPHDATFSFIPSRKGAFAAARAFQDISGYRAGRGVSNLLGKVCLDQWGGSYARAAADLRRAAQAGLTDAVFVKHIWQRWGYDYRLPEIFPPDSELGTEAAFLEMRRAAAEAGILFCPHDNYIDFYPDAEGFSYDRILFNANGTPQLAWFNAGRGAQSYRWLPHGFRPELESNMTKMRDAFQPDALFIDVFTAMAPIDYLDRAGTYFTRARTAREWGDAFNTCREILGHRAPMISEAGCDSLIGSVDAGEADHFPASRWMPVSQFADSERVPWHDMVTHRKMVLLGGGLGSRYSAIDWENYGDSALHGYGSDDYLCNSVIGGRNPMCEGSFCRRTVMTYWLLHDVSAAFARLPFESHAFGPTIHQQHTVFGRNAEVWSNRATNRTWTVAGHELPCYGFYAKAGEAEAGIVLIHGRRAAFAKSPDAFFADSRPASFSDVADVETRVTGGQYDGNGKFTLACEVTVLRASHGFVPFVHIIHPGDALAAQGWMDLKPHALEKTGTFRTSIILDMPASFQAGDYEVRYGFFHSKDGSRLSVQGPGESDQRILGGTCHLEKKDGAFTAASSFTLAKKTSPVPAASDTMLSFGPVSTDGAFRLIHGRRGFWQRLTGRRPDWELLSLPGSKPFHAEIDLAAFGAAGAKVTAIEEIEPTDNPVTWSQAGDRLALVSKNPVARYRIRF